MKTVLLLASLLPAPAGASAFLPEVFFLLPAGSSVAVRVAVPPAEDAVLARLGWSDARFSVGPGGSVWFFHDGEEAVSFSSGRRLRLDRPFQDAAALPGGGLLFVAEDDLGFAVESEGLSARASAFQPFARLPVEDARLFPGDRGVLYVAGTGRRSGRREVWALGPEPPAGGRTRGPVRTLRKVLSTTEKVSAVAGDGRDCFVAIGRMVARVDESKGGLSPVFLHPSEEVSGLGYSAAAGLFYATVSGAGALGSEGSAEFLRAPAPALLARGPDLFVFLRDSLAVLRVEGAGRIRRYIPGGPSSGSVRDP